MNFSNCKLAKTRYSGINGKKIAVYYNNNEIYMLKFNMVYQEYLGCKIYESVGIPTQEVILGEYRGKPVVACKDFRKYSEELCDFISIKNTVLDVGYNNFELDEILETIRKQRLIDIELLENRFWDMFIIDALIDNCNRHCGDWGIVVDRSNWEVRLAPVYDCGSSFTYNGYSRMKINNKSIKYSEFILSLDYDGCNEALKRIVPKIDLDYINSIIDNMPIDNKQIYKELLKNRKENILDCVLLKLQLNQIP